MRILAFGASNSRNSLNKSLAYHAADLFKAEVLPTAEIELLDLNDYEMPIYSIDRETENGIPDKAHAFYAAIGNADGLIISFAEHNGSYTAAFKNSLDWMTRIDRRIYQAKPLLLLSTSPGQGGGANVMKTALTGAAHFGAEVVGSLSVKSFHQSFDLENRTLVDPDLKNDLLAALKALGNGSSG